MFMFMSQEQLDQMKMQMEENMNTLLRIFDELDSEDLNEMRDFINAISHDSSLGFYWVGQLDAKMRQQEFVKLTQSDDEVTIPNSQSGERIQVPDPELGETEPKWVQGMLDLDGKEAGTSAENIEKNMELYGVLDFRQSNGVTGVCCANCGMKYPSLEDRMLREPGAEGCPGCRDKAMWG